MERGTNSKTGEGGRMITLDTQALPTCRRVRPHKVYYGYYDYEFGHPHPVIRLGGKYLEAYGFQIGDRIHVVLDFNQITITRIGKQSRQSRDHQA